MQLIAVCFQCIDAVGWVEKILFSTAAYGQGSNQLTQVLL